MRSHAPLAAAALAALSFSSTARAQLFDADRLAEAHNFFYSSLVHEDFDGDGFTDIAATMIAADFYEADVRLRVFWGLPDGTFERGRDIGAVKRGSLTVNPQAHSAAWADLDGDGSPELVVAFDDSEPTVLSFRVDAGSREWTPSSSYAFPSPRYTGLRTIRFADLDGDGDDDLVFASNVDGSSRSVAGWRERGPGGALLDPVELTVDTHAIFALALGDQDGDRDLDLLAHVESNGAREYAWFPNDGASLSAPVVLGSVATGPGVNPRLVAGDVDGDGDADAVVLRNAASGHQLSLFRSEGPVSAGAGSIGPETLLVPDAGGPEAIALAPIAAPGALDLVLSSRSLGVRVAPATGAGGYGPLVPMGTPSGATLGTWAVGDDDGDRLADVLVATQNMFNGSRQNALRLHRNASVGGVPALEAGVAAVPPTSTDPRAVVGDVTSDGFVDVVLSDRFVGTVRVFRGDAEGSVRTWVEVPTGLDRTQRIRIANVDGNESVDIVALDTDSSTLAWVAHRRVDASWTPHAIGSAGVDALDFVLFDDDLDGDLDVLVLTTPSSIRHEVVLFEQLSPGLFAAPRTVYGFTSIAYPRTFDAHDLDADGRPELLLGVSNGVFEGLRALGRTPAGDYALTDRFGVMGPAHAPDTCSHISVGDLDGDGDPDVVPTRWNGDHRLTWYENIDGTLFEARPLLFGGVPSPLACIRSTAVLDADGDGDLDIAASGSGLGSALLLYENRGGGSFAPAFPSTERRSVGVDLTVVDIDGDGRDDCVGPWFSRRGVTLFRARATNDFGGSAFCGPVLSNSTGRFGRMGMSGSDVASEGRATLHAWDLPQQSFGLFATSRTLASVGVVPGSVGRLCLGGTIGRFVAPGQIQGSGWSGSFTLEIDPGALPQGGTAAPAVAGESWYFQAWHRDVVGGAQTSNFTEGLEVVWR